MELLEYTFYMEDKVGSDDTEDLLLGAKKLYEQDPLPDGGSTEEGGGEEDPFEEDTSAGGIEH